MIPTPKVTIITPQIKMTKVTSPPLPIVIPKPIVPKVITSTPTLIAQPQITVPKVIAPTPSTPTLVAQPQITVPKVIAPTPSTPTVIAQPQITVPKQTTQNIPQGSILRQFGGRATMTITTTPKTIAAPTVRIVEETGRSMLLEILNVWAGNEEKIEQLLNLRYDDGSSIIDIKRRDVFLEIIGMLRSEQFEEVIDFLRTTHNPEQVLWNQKSMNVGRNKVLREIEIQQAEEVGVKGVGKCRYCPSTELVFATKQLRSADEPSTIFVTCVMCQKRWRQ